MIASDVSHRFGFPAAGREVVELRGFFSRNEGMSCTGQYIVNQFAGYRNFGFDRLFEAAEIAKFNPKELGEYWESLKNFRDWYSVMSTQLKKGREEGLKEGLEKGLQEGLEKGLQKGLEKGLQKGLEKGRKEECFKNAKKMKQAGIASDIIAHVTGLSMEEIASL